MIKIIYILAIIALIYAIIVALFYVFQRPMLYPGWSRNLQEKVLDAPDGFENFDVTTSDNINLRGWYHKADTGKPTMVYFHGNGDFLSQTADYHKLIIEQGYGVLLTSYRGYSGHKGTPSEKGLYKDARAYINTLIKSGVQESDMILYGFSLGTGVATKMANEYPNIKALMLGAPYTSIKAVAQYHYTWLPISALLKDTFDSLSLIHNINAPILIIHGRDDGLVPPSHAETLAQANPRVDLVTMPGDHAGFYDLGGAEAVAQWVFNLEK